MTRWSVRTCSILLAVMAAPCAIAQEPTFRARVQIVPLYATVMDQQKRLVPDLVKGDFEILDDGKPQEIRVFLNEVQPITVVVMLDTSASMTGSFKLLQLAAEQFLLRLLPGDRGSVGAFNDKIEFVSDFTSNRDQLVASLKDIDFGNPTRLYDALGASLDRLRGIEGRRVILIFTDGEDTASKLGFGRVLERARNEEVMVYAVGLESDYFNGARQVRTKPDPELKRLAGETGGGYFELTKSSELASTFTRVAQELHSQYVLGFTPEVLDGRVHKLALRVRRPGVNVRARQSYVAAPPQTSTRDATPLPGLAGSDAAVQAQSARAVRRSRLSTR